jgi:hypothetical protein
MPPPHQRNNHLIVVFGAASVHRASYRLTQIARAVDGHPIHAGGMTSGYALARAASRNLF